MPTRAEPGYPGFSAALWVGFWGPASTPPAVVTKISADLAKALQSAEVQEHCARTGNEVRLMSQPDFARFVREVIESNKRLVHSAGIALQ